MNKRELLRGWLRGKNYHIDDIASALEFYDRELREGRSPSDKSILKIADKSHKRAISISVKKLASGKPVLIKYETQAEGTYSSVFVALGISIGVIIMLVLELIGV
jgi:hypothetical protein